MSEPTKYDRLLEACRSLPPLPTAVVHPCDAAAIEAAVGAARLGLIQPILVGPAAKIRDAARRAGNEFLFQMLAETNVEVMNGYNVKKIITTCPHGYHSLKHEYRQFGGNYEVWHHSQFLKKLIAEGKDINYEGASGPVDFDAAGDVAGFYSVNRVGDDGKYTMEYLR